MMTRQELIDSLSDNELVEAVADRLILSLQREADEHFNGDLTHVSVSSTYDDLDWFREQVEDDMRTKLH